MKKLLKNYKKHFIYTLIILFNLSKNTLEANASFNSLEHKEGQQNLYLDLIRYNCQEKIGILSYILERKSGTFLEIGTGGGPIADMLDKIPLSH